MKTSDMMLTLIIFFSSLIAILAITGNIPWTLISPYGAAAPPPGVYWNFISIIILFIIIPIAISGFFSNGIIKSCHAGILTVPHLPGFGRGWVCHK